MKSILRSFLLIFVLIPAVGIGASILNIEDEPISLKTDGTSFTDQEVRIAIIDGCIAKGWSAILDEEGAIHAKILVRKRYAVEVEITHTPESYSITYVSSDNLNYNDKRQTIHGKYNRWIQNLRASINKKFLVNSTNSTQDIATESKKQDVYSELLKLDDLRNRGLLTDEEFEAEKQKLLERD
jgi:hypothetical protein